MPVSTVVRISPSDRVAVSSEDRKSPALGDRIRKHISGKTKGSHMSIGSGKRSSTTDKETRELQEGSSPE